MVLVIVGKPPILTWRAVACFLAGWSFPLSSALFSLSLSISIFKMLLVVDLLVGERWHAFWQRGHFLFHLNCFHFHFLFPSSSCCLLSTYLLESGRMFFGGGAISSEPQETTPCQKRRWRGREGAA